MIIKNSIKCLNCKDEIISRSNHDYVECSCGSVSVDGGQCYLKRSGKYEETSVTTHSSIEEIREAFMWGSYGKNGDEPLKLIKLKDLEDSHLLAIIKSQKRLGQEIISLFVKELQFRS